MNHPSQDAERADRLAAEGRVDQALVAYRAARDAYAARGDAQEALDCALDAGYLLVHSHRPAEAIAWFEWACNATADPLGRAQALVGLAAAEMDVGRCNRAISLLDEAYADFGSVADLAGMALAQFELGNALDNLEDHEGSLRCHGIALGHYEQVGDHEGVARTLQAMGSTHRAMGRTMQAIDLHVRARELWEELADLEGVANCTFNLGSSYWALHDHERAHRYYEDAHDLYDTIGSRVQAADCAHAIGDLLLLDGGYLEAAHRLRAARAVYGDVDNDVRLARCDSTLGWCALHMGELDQARAWFESSVSRYAQTDYESEVARARVGIAIAADRQGDTAGARAIMAGVKDVLGPQDPDRWCPECLQDAVDLGLETV